MERGRGEVQQWFPLKTEKKKKRRNGKEKKKKIREKRKKKEEEKKIVPTGFSKAEQEQEDVTYQPLSLKSISAGCCTSDQCFKIRK